MQKEMGGEGVSRLKEVGGLVRRRAIGGLVGRRVVGWFG